MPLNMLGQRRNKNFRKSGSCMLKACKRLSMKSTSSKSCNVACRLAVKLGSDSKNSGYFDASTLCKSLSSKLSIA